MNSQVPVSFTNASTVGVVLSIAKNNHSPTVKGYVLSACPSASTNSPHASPIVPPLLVECNLINAT